MHNCLQSVQPKQCCNVPKIMAYKISLGWIVVLEVRAWGLDSHSSIRRYVFSRRRWNIMIQNRLMVATAVVTSTLVCWTRDTSSWWRQTWDTCLFFTCVSHSKSGIGIKHGPLAKYIKLWVAHAPWMPRTLHRGLAILTHIMARVTHVPCVCRDR